MSIASEITRIQNNIAAAYSACDGKGAGLPQMQNSENLAATILTIPQSGGGVSMPSDVNFRNYDGALLYTYTAEQASALTELPALPTNEGLISQGWTHTLVQIKSAVQKGYPVDVGAVCTTDDGSTKLYLFVKNGTRIPDLQIWVNMAANTSAIVDWGDGTTGTINNTSASVAAVYAQKTNYTEVTEDTVLCVRIIGGSFVIGYDYSHTVFGNSTSTQMNTPVLLKAEFGNNCTGIYYRAFQRCSSLTSVVIPQGVTSIGQYAFSDCSSLTSVVIPQGVTSIGQYAFSDCSSLTSVVIPQGVTSIGQNAFNSCYSLTSVVIPQGVTSIAQYAFNYCFSLTSVVIPQSVTSIAQCAFFNCSSLTSVVIPQSVTSIAQYAFYYCHRLYEVDLTAYTDPTAMPALSNANAFSDIPTYTKFMVLNAEMLTAFSSATNWSAYASRFEVKA